jgi:hypothetical protein
VVERGADIGGVPRRDPGFRAQTLQVLAFVLTFALIGPPVGTVVIAIVKGLDGTLYGFRQIPGSIVLGIVTGTCYAIGGFPAAVAGLMVEMKQAFAGDVGWRFALFTGVVIGIPLAFVFRDAAATIGIVKVLAEFCIVTTLSTLACWRIPRPWFAGHKVTT